MPTALLAGASCDFLPVVHPSRSARVIQSNDTEVSQNWRYGFYAELCRLLNDQIHGLTFCDSLQQGKLQGGFGQWFCCLRYSHLGANAGESIDDSMPLVSETIEQYDGISGSESQNPAKILSLLSIQIY
jgi:hypothetical protein